MAIHHNFIPEAFLPPKEVTIPRPGQDSLAMQLPPERIIWLDETESTHMLLKRGDYDSLPPYTMVAARRQTAGRGQRGNSWEAEPGKNLTFSMTASPGWIPPSVQFVISEAFALSICRVLLEYGINPTVKWPNDIYVGDRKICGILIEHSILDMAISRTILSAGINVNQTEFQSDAPNPVSMAQLQPLEYNLDAFARQIRSEAAIWLEATRTALGRQQIHQSFMTLLWRGDGRYYPFQDNIQNQIIQARIAGIDPDGRLHLQLKDSSLRSFLFKETSFILKL